LPPNCPKKPRIDRLAGKKKTTRERHLGWWFLNSSRRFARVSGVVPRLKKIPDDSRSLAAARPNLSRSRNGLVERGCWFLTYRRRGHGGATRWVILVGEASAGRVDDDAQDRQRHTARVGVTGARP